MGENVPLLKLTFGMVGYFSLRSHRSLTKLIYWYLSVFCNSWHFSHFNILFMLVLAATCIWEV